MIQAQLFVLGTERELLSTDLECYRTQNPTTVRPGPIPMGGLVTLTFVSGAGDDRLLYGLTHSPEGELCTLTTAKVVFYAGDPDGVVLFEYRLKDAAFVHWKEEFNATGEAPMTVTLVISAAILEIKGVTWVKPWRESEVPAEEDVAYKEGMQRGFSDDRGKKGDDEGIALGIAARASNVGRTIHGGAQGKHIPGHNNYVPAKNRSILKSDAQSLLDDFHSGNIKSSQTINDVKTRVDFGKEIGTYINKESGVSIPTTNGIIHTGKNGVHIVPAAPN